MHAAISETNRRRKVQDEYNKAHGIVPKTIVKSVRNLLEISGSVEEADEKNDQGVKMTPSEKAALLAKLEGQMKEAARMLEFEYAAELRDRIIRLRGEDTAKSVSALPEKPGGAKEKKKGRYRR
jgi:excinuclease ABC subunit B